MKKLFLIGAIVLLLLTMGVLLVIQHHQNGTASQTAEEKDMDAIITSLPPDLPPETYSYIRTIKNDIRTAKEAGDEEWAAELEKDLAKEIQEILNPPELPEEEHEWVQHYEDEIRKAKKEGQSEQYIAGLEKLRDIHLQGIAEDEAAERIRQEERASVEAMSHEERIDHYEDKLSEAEEELRIAKSEGDASDIQWAEWTVQALNSDIDWEKKKLAWIPVQKELDAGLKKWEEVERPRLIAEYRSYLHIEVIDGQERIVGVKTPAEIDLPDRNLFPSDDEDSLLPAGSSLSLPDRSDVVPSSQGKPLPSSPQGAQQPTPTAAMDSIVKAQTQFNAWRKDLDKDYLDVVLSRYMTPENLDKYFPTASDRQNLDKRTERLQSEVVSKIRSITSHIPNATADHKRAVARDILSQNFDKDFAEAVLKALQKDGE